MDKYVLPLLTTRVRYAGKRNKVPTFFQKWHSKTFQWLIKDKIVFSKQYQIIIWCITNALFCNKITSHTLNYNLSLILGAKCIKTHIQIRLLGPLLFKPISHFQVFFFFRKIANFQGQIEISRTFEDSSEIQSFLKVCGNHGRSTLSLRFLVQPGPGFLFLSPPVVASCGRPSCLERSLSRPWPPSGFRIHFVCSNVAWTSQHLERETGSST